MHSLDFSSYKLSRSERYAITVVIPSWNNLAMLKLCVSSIRQHSSLNVQIIVVLNEGTDGSLEWCKEQKDKELDMVHFIENAGICFGLNACRSLIKADWIVYLNDDMYVLPEWDKALHQKAISQPNKAVLLSGTLIEPRDSGNKVVVVKDFGSDLESFKEEKLVLSSSNLKRSDWSGSSWPPLMLHVKYWDLIGGMSVEFHPGMYSDPDLSMKMHKAGVRDFIGVGSSLVYHFGSKSTARIKKNKGRSTFLLKWGISSGKFYRESLLMGETPQKAKEIRTDFLSKIKRIYTALMK